MNVTETGLEGCLLLEPKKYGDDRGYFFERFNLKLFQEIIGESIDFVQDNQSYSKKNVIRGLHAQKGDFEQAKLVSVLSGSVLDVVVDIRKGSKTFGESFSVELSEENNLQLFVPRGFLHGFQVLSQSAQFYYKCDNFYNKESELGVVYNDPSLNLPWRNLGEDKIVSIKDLELPFFTDIF